ncbi:MAG: hypothetical protein ACJ76L_15340 [Conexibacter sp.]
MIRDLAEITLENGTAIVYAAVAGAVSFGAVVGVVAVWISTAAWAGRR